MLFLSFGDRMRHYVPSHKGQTARLQSAVSEFIVNSSTCVLDSHQSGLPINNGAFLMQGSKADARQKQKT
ncbi:hypothetical protein RRF57_013097 [Xylaria bambusicola]|uniref:Uncharacterized protein n=1 Tax=Xylaria bambusicola TaxID=326684 RepID=A0AAN7Z524_9PEZI